MARSLLPLPLLLAACSTAFDEPAAPVLTDTEAYVARELLVAVDDGTDGVATVELEAEYGLTTIDTVHQIGLAHVELPGDGMEKEMAALLEADHRVRYAEPNYIALAAGRPNDPYIQYQWNMDQVRAWEAHDITEGKGVVVAVLDTGVSTGGPDGIANLLSGWDFAYNDSSVNDVVGHGTFVAGTINQATDNGTGLAGLAPGASILPVKVLGDNGSGSASAIVNGITWAADQGADVINMSLGSAYYSRAEEEACQYAYDKGVVLVAASGNEFASSVSYPAAFDTVIAVGASRYDGTRSGYSNTGSGLELTAPGGDLSKDQNGDGYADGVLQETIDRGQWTYVFWEGTSMASPHVAAAAALLKSVGVSDPDDVRAYLAQSAVDMGAAGYDTTYGYGLLDARGALDLALGNDTGGGTTTDPGTDTGTDPGTDTGTDPGTDTGADQPDTTGPVISNVTGEVNGANFTIMWTTDEPADSYITFDGYGTYGDDALVNSHALSFVGSVGATYVFTISSTDENGNTTEDGKWQITL